MFSVTVRDHIMVAHSLPGQVFGPAQRLHGATFVVDATFRRAELDANQVVLDIGRAAQQLGEVLAALNYRNLDDEPDFAGQVTTTEVLARVIADRLVARIRAGDLGDSARDLAAITVTLHESHLAWASYERDLRTSPGDQQASPGGRRASRRDPLADELDLLADEDGW